MESYIVINGKKAELTEEQLKALGIATEKESPFARCKDDKIYYYINGRGRLEPGNETQSSFDHDIYGVANYCTDKDLMQQRAWHEILNRLLWRYSMEHDGNKIDWNNKNQLKHIIFYDHSNKNFATDTYMILQFDSIYFYTREIAENAIKEIIEPFMKEHPDFVW